MIYKAIVETIEYGLEVWAMKVALKSKLLATKIDALQIMRKGKLERLKNNCTRHEINALRKINLVWAPK